MKVTVARIYLTEGSKKHQKIFQRLHDEHQVKGVTMYRAISGFGASGDIHSSSLLDMSLDLPLIIEFFDAEEKVEAALESIEDLVPAGHVVTFEAQLN